MLSVTINGKLFEFAEGLTVLQASQNAGVDIPNLCSDDRLKPAGCCRLCAVEVMGSSKPVIACVTPLRDGMEVQTHTPKIEELRKSVLRLLAQAYPSESYHKYPGYPFHELIRKYGLENELSDFKTTDLIDDLHPYIYVDRSRCIDCYRCVRICEELQGQFVWKTWNSGNSTKIATATEGSLADSSCLSCGACVDTCPTGALEDQTLSDGVKPERWIKTTCPYCGTGCELNAGAWQDRILTIRPVVDGPVSKGHLCVKGRYAFDFGRAADRITKPMIRNSGEWEEVSWHDAIELISKKLNAILEKQGPDSIGMLGSARATNEENYLTQKFARVVLGTNNVDCCARVCHAPTAAGMKRILGTGAATNSFNDIEQARTIIVCGANPTENHPVVGARIKQAARKGAHLIVIDPRRTDLVQFADLHISLLPGTNVPFLNSMANVIIHEKLYDASFVRSRVSGWDEFCEEISKWTPETAGEICGIDPDLIRKAARVYATETPGLILHGLGVTEHEQGTESVICLVNLALITGNIGKTGSGINPLRGQNNVQGSAHMGCEPDHLTGYVPIEEARPEFEALWGAAIPSRKGLNLMQMIDSAAGGILKALWVIGYDVYLTNPFSAFTNNALGNLEFVIVQDLFLNETARRFGSVFLPVCSSFEKDGTFMNAERRIQPVRKVIDPPGECMPDWKIICQIATAMGKGELFNFRNAEEIWNEIRTVWPAGKGITYERLEHGGLQWPCADKDQPGTSILHQNHFSHGKRAFLQAIPYRAPRETTDAIHPFLLITGRTLYHFNAGTMTNRTKNIELQESDFLEINSEDAERLHLQPREIVRITSRYGEATLPIRFSSSLRKGQLFATFHTPKFFLNRLTGPNRDAFTQTPDYKITAVNVEKL